MPLENGVGYGDHTANKQSDFSSLLSLHIDIVDEITAKPKMDWQREYTYVDMNAGPGEYNGLIGSPILFLNKIESTEIPYRATFIELVKENADKLKEAISGRSLRGRASVINANHACSLRDLEFNRATHGLVYHDPSGSIPDFDLLAEVSRKDEFRFMDLMIYLSATNIKRVRRFEEATGTDAKAKLLTNYLDGISKKTWIIRKSQGQHQWTFVIGSNWCKFPEWKSKGFYRVDSPEGQSVLKHLTYTAREVEEMSGQMSLDYVQSAMEQMSFFNLPAPKMHRIATTESI